MKPAPRTQVDDLAEEYSLLTQLDCSDFPDQTRQEFKQETNVNYILSRFGVNTPLRETAYGEIDYNMDLQQSLTAINEAQQAVRKLPEPLRDKYYHWELLLEGMRSGQLKADLDAHLAEQTALTNTNTEVIIPITPTQE